MPETPLLLGGARTPFRAAAGPYSPLQAHELAGRLLVGLLERSGVDPDAVVGVADAVALGRVELGLAGGVETFSDVPIRLGRQLRRTAMKVRQARDARTRLRALADLRPRDLRLEFPRSADDATGLSMGVATERTARLLGIDRSASDAWAARSHARAVAARTTGLVAPELVPVTVDGVRVDEDDGPRTGSTPEVLARLAPAFDGIITAGSASGFTDGAAAVLLGTAAAAERHGLAPLAAVRDVVHVGVDDPWDEHLLGPALAVPRLLARAGLAMADVAVVELHEAFAAQVLAVQARLVADGHAPLDEERLNARGGSIALGNPFGATGARLLTTAARRLHHEDGRFAVVASCAGGGLGSALLLERV